MSEEDTESGCAHDDEASGAARVVSWRARSVGLAPVDVDDAELLHRWRADPTAVYEIGIWPRSLTAMRERIERNNDNDDQDDFLVLLPDGTPVGHAALTHQSMVNGTAEVELMLAPEHRRNGYGVAALDALVDLAFGELPMHRLVAETHAENAAALAVLGRSGFVREGTSRSACLHRGRRLDIAVCSLLRAEWEALDRPRAWED